MRLCVSRLEDSRLVQGRGRYSDDVNLLWHAYVVVVACLTRRRASAASRSRRPVWCLSAPIWLPTASAPCRPTPPAGADGAW